MKYLKLFGLAAMTAAALAAFAVPASATPVLTSPAGTEYTGAMTLTATGSLLTKASLFESTCTESTIATNVTTNNTDLAGGAITTLTYSNCDTTVHVLANGSLSINNKGEVRGSGTQVTKQKVGITCTYGTTTNTPLGTLTSGNPAVIHVNASLPRIAGGFLCANPAAFQGQYTVTSPKPLLLN